MHKTPSSRHNTTLTTYYHPSHHLHYLPSDSTSAKSFETYTNLSASTVTVSREDQQDLHHDQDHHNQHTLASLLLSQSALPITYLWHLIKMFSQDLRARGKIAKINLSKSKSQESAISSSSQTTTTTPSKTIPIQTTSQTRLTSSLFYELLLPVLLLCLLIASVINHSSYTTLITGPNTSSSSLFKYIRDTLTEKSNHLVKLTSIISPRFMSPKGQTKIPMSPFSEFDGNIKMTHDSMDPASLCLAGLLLIGFGIFLS